MFNIALLLVPSTLITAFTTLQPQHNDLYYGSLLAAYAVSLSTYLAALLASVVLYRLAPFHPLAKYPGPLGARISKFWMAAIGVGGRSHVYIKLLHEKYASDVVRIGQSLYCPASRGHSDRRMLELRLHARPACCRPERAIDSRPGCHPFNTGRARFG